MLDQIYRIQTDLGERVSNVVVMGSGEPMDNYDNLIRFIHLLTDEHGLNISQRNITVSYLRYCAGYFKTGRGGFTDYAGIILLPLT